MKRYTPLIIIGVLISFSFVYAEVIPAQNTPLSPSTQSEKSDKTSLPSITRKDLKIKIAEVGNLLKQKAQNKKNELEKARTEFKRGMKLKKDTLKTKEVILNTIKQKKDLSKTTPISN